MSAASFRKATLLFPVLALTACDASSPEVHVETTDSAGIAIVTSQANDLPVHFSSEAARMVGDTGDAESLYWFNQVNTAVDGNGRIYVLDTEAHRVHVFDSAGARVTVFGREGGGPGELRFPLALAVSSTGIVRVADAGKDKFVQWNSQGAPLPELDLTERYRGGPISWTEAGVIVTEWGAGFQRVTLLRDNRETMTLAEVTDLPQKAMALPSCGMRFTGMSPIFSPDLPWAAYGDRIVIARNPEYVLDEYVGGRHVRSIRRNIPPREATAELAKASLGDALRVRTDGGERICDPRKSSNSRVSRRICLQSKRLRSVRTAGCGCSATRSARSPARSTFSTKMEAILARSRTAVPFRSHFCRTAAFWSQKRMIWTRSGL